MQQEVNLDDLEFGECDELTLHGAAFTGLATERHSDGSISAIYYFLEGLNHGLCRDYHPNGQLGREWYAVHGRAEGQLTEWHNNGKVKSVKVYEFGVELEFSEWDSEGKLLVSRQLDEHSHMMKYVREMRRRAANEEG